MGPSYNGYYEWFATTSCGFDSHRLHNFFFKTIKQIIGGYQGTGGFLGLDT